MFKTYFAFFLMMLSFNLVAAENYIVTADSVRVRSAPSLNGKSLLSLNKGQEVIKLQEKGQWSNIQFQVSGSSSEQEKKEGWMHSSFLAKKDSVVETEVPETLKFANENADLMCDKNPDTQLIEACDLELQYSLQQSVGLQSFKVECSAELQASTKNSDVLPVPVSQMLEHPVDVTASLYSMHILMRADASYELQNVTLEGYSCQLVGYNK